MDELSNDLTYAGEKTAMVQIEEQRAIQEVQAQVILANKFPRDIMQCREKILAECKRPLFAEKAMYQYKRGSTNIIGPSIRMAEMLARNWKNLAFGIKEVGQREGFSDLRSFAWDMENNVYEERTFTVPHIRYSKEKGNTKLTDPRDIYENNANQGARRMRACILAHISIDIMEEAIDEVNKTLVNSLVGSKGKDRLKKMLEMFAKVGVNQTMIESHFNSKLKNLSGEEMAELVRIYNSLKDGIGKPKDYFETAKEPQSKTAKDLQDKIVESAQNKTTEPEPEEKPDKEPEPEQEVPEEESPSEDEFEPNKINLQSDTWKEANVPGKEADKWLDAIRDDLYSLLPFDMDEKHITSIGDFMRAFGCKEFTTHGINPRIYQAMRDYINKEFGSQK